MARQRYRRVIKIDNGGGNFIFRTCRITSTSTNPAFLINRFFQLQQKFAADYDTSNIWVDPAAGQLIPGYFPQQPGEIWNWVNPPP